MKKLIAMIGAVAMSFGLYADGPTLFSTSFETGDDGVSGLTWTPGVSWSGPTGPLTLKTGDRVLPTGYGAESDDDPMTRRDSKFAAVGTNDNWLELSTGSDELTLAVESGNKVVDQLVKFTGFDAEPEVADDSKIAVWMSEYFNEDETEATTNLFVTCGKVTELGTSLVTLQIDKAFELDKWYRLSIFSLEDGTADSYKGYKIFIDGELITSAAAKSIALKDNMPAKVKALMDKGALFPSLKDSAAIASVSYKGIGAIDDIIVDENGPAFRTDATVTIPALAFATATGYKVGEGGVIIPLTGNTFDVEPGSEVTVFFDPVGTKLLTKNFYTVTVADSMTLDATAIEAALQPKDVVATILDPESLTGDEFKFATLADALVKVKELEVDGEAVEISIIKTVDAETIPNAGVLGFDAGTAIAVNPDGAVGTWLIVGNARLGADIAAGKVVTVMANDDDTALAGTLAYAGAVAGSLTAATLTKYNGTGTITIAETGNVTVGRQIAEYKTFFAAPTDFEVKETANADTTYTYTVEHEAPAIDYVTFTVSYEASKIENVTVTTNGEAVVDITGNYIVESNAVVTITADAADGFKNVRITSDHVTVVDGVFTADKAGALISITAEAMVYAKVPDITDSYTYNGEVQTVKLDNGDGYVVVGNSDQQKNAGVHQVEVALKTGYDAWEDDNSSTNKFVAWTIDQAVVNVTAKDKTIKVGDGKPANFEVTISPEPFGTDTIAHTVDCPTYEDKEGEYAIVVTPGTNPNYDVSGTPGKLKVEAAGPVIPEPEDLPEAEKAVYNNWYTSNPADPGDVALTKSEDLKDAYLLSCKAGEEALEAARKEFKFASIEFKNGAWVATIKNSTGDSHEFYGNGAITVKSYSDVECKTEAEDGNFFKATLGYKTK